MILRIALFALMAFGLLGFGTVAWIAGHPQDPPRSATETEAPRAVLALARDVRAGTLLKSDDLTTRTPTADTISAGHLVPDTPDARSGLVGGMARRALRANEFLKPDDVLGPGDHGFLAAVLTPGMRAVAVAVDPVSGTAGLIWPGDRVDVILTQANEDQSLPVGRRVAAETVFRDARVIAIDQQIVRSAVPGPGDATPPRTVTLEMTQAEAERVQVAARIGRLSLSVRAADQSGGRSAIPRPAVPPPSGVARPLAAAGAHAEPRGGPDEEPVANPPGASSPARQALAPPGSPAVAEGPVWASDVSRAYREAPKPPPPNTLRIFHGTAGVKEQNF